MLYQIDPVPKPRMTQRDKWKERPSVMRYWAYRDEIRTRKIELPEFPTITFGVKMPKSWSLKRRLKMDGDPHKVKPDIDNLLKGLLDAIYDDDAHVWNVVAIKQWSMNGYIKVEAR